MFRFTDTLFWFQKEIRQGNMSSLQMVALWMEMIMPGPEIVPSWKVEAANLLGKRTRSSVDDSDDSTRLRHPAAAVSVITGLRPDGAVPRPTAANCGQLRHCGNSCRTRIYT
jgi:hypothetical protein